MITTCHVLLNDEALDRHLTCIKKNRKDNYI